MRRSNKTRRRKRNKPKAKVSRRSRRDSAPEIRVRWTREKKKKKNYLRQVISRDVEIIKLGPPSRRRRVCFVGIPCCNESIQGVRWNSSPESIVSQVHRGKSSSFPLCERWEEDTTGMKATYQLVFLLQIRCCWGWGHTAKKPKQSQREVFHSTSKKKKWD